MIYSFDFILTDTVFYFTSLPNHIPQSVILFHFFNCLFHRHVFSITVYRIVYRVSQFESYLYCTHNIMHAYDGWMDGSWASNLSLAYLLSSFQLLQRGNRPVYRHPLCPKINMSPLLPPPPLPISSSMILSHRSTDPSDPFSHCLSRLEQW